MDSPRVAMASWVMLLDVLYLSSSLSSSSLSQDRPIHTIVFFLSGLGLGLVIFRRLFSRLLGPRNIDGNSVSPIDEGSSPNHRPGDGATKLKLDLQLLRQADYLVLSTALLVAFRIEVFRQVNKAPECAVNGWTVFLPFLLSLYQWRRPHSLSELQAKPAKSHMDDTIYNALHRRYMNLQSRYVLPALLVSVGSYYALGIWYVTPSTHICPLAGRQIHLVPILQFVGLGLDFCIAIAVNNLLNRARSTESARESAAVRLGTVFLASAASWLVVGAVVYLAKPAWRSWLLAFDLLFDPGHIISLLFYLFMVIVAMTSAAASMYHLGVLEVSIELTTFCVALPSIVFLWSDRHPFPPISYMQSLGAFVSLLSGNLAFKHVQQVAFSSKPLKGFVYFLLVLSFCAVLYPTLSHPRVSHFHPIDLLIYEAKERHEYLATYSTQSYNIDEAAAQYRRRYRMNPPPGFDIWYKYATTRKSVIIDQYDQIHQDLLPFWAVPPSQLRQTTWELNSNPWNDIGGISVRSGKAAVLENVPGTHRWMLDGVVSLIDKFAKHLPDMDLAFNLNDEARVAVPYSNLQKMLSAATAILDRPSKESWSKDRTKGWKATTKEPYTKSVLLDRAFKNTFYEFGSVSCPPKSASRKNRQLSPSPYLCLSCAAPHSMGPFLANWTLSASPCHQPDLAHLHGFYMSPAAFRGSHSLVPIFSQSKPHGFADILYPSAWNYQEKTVYAPTAPSGEPNTPSYKPGHPDPPYDEKENTLFWRGATSEGKSDSNAAWRGMTRQRMVHLANNLTSSAHDTVALLLPTSNTKNPKHRYHQIPGSAIRDLNLATNISIVNGIARCGGLDCLDQELELPLRGPISFQDHWRYRYLLDMDGAGFSGRFLAFLHSHSLPFKTAVFREWYDDRLTAWHHFVPVDVRLHGVWSTLAYFAGIKSEGPVPRVGSGGKKGVIVPAREREGRMIAEQGREWAGKVLRKEDMEIYMFRMLLEWGRLTDDRREDMGFVPTTSKKPAGGQKGGA